MFCSIIQWVIEILVNIFKIARNVQNPPDYIRLGLKGFHIFSPSNHSNDIKRLINKYRDKFKQIGYMLRCTPYKDDHSGSCDIFQMVFVGDLDFE